jgi:hypothetical protein
LSKGGRTINDFEQPLMLNMGAAEPDLDVHQRARVMTWELQAATLVTEIAMNTDIKMRRRLRQMEHR